MNGPTPIAQAPLTPEKNHRATILVVDDEPAVRMVIAEILQRQGYRVLSCATGGEALNVFRSVAGCIDLVLMDLTLPDVNGQQLILDLRKIRPEARVLTSSGYPGAGGFIAEESEITSYIQKPFDSHSLGHAVAMALGTPIS